MRPKPPFLLTFATGRRLALVAVIDSIGTGLFLAGATVFAIEEVGLSAAQYGLAMSLAGGLGLVSAVPIGRLGDRFRAHGLLLVVQLWRCVWFCALAFCQDFWSFTATAALLAVGEAVTPPLTQAVVSTASGEARVRAMASLRVLRNVGFSMGAIAAAPLLATGGAGARAAVLMDAATFLLAAAVLRGLRLPSEPQAQLRRPALDRGALADGWYLALTGANTVLTLHMTLLTIGLPLWLLANVPGSNAVVALLVATNTILVIACQVPLSRRAESVSGAEACLRWAAFALAVACWSMAFVPDVPRWAAILLVFSAMGAMTVGEIWQSAAGWELSYRFAAKARQVEYLAVFNLSTGVQQVAGPLLLTGVVIASGAVGWIVLGLFFCCVPLVLAPVIRSLIRRTPPEPGAEAAAQAGSRAS